MMYKGGMGNIKYKTLDFIGRSDHMVGSDGSIWSKARDGRTWVKRKISRNAKDDERSCICINVAGRNKTFMVYRLVLEAFIGPCPEGMEACHFPDRDPANNHLTNLRWDTRVNNFKDRDYHGTTARGERNGASKLKARQVLKIRERWKKEISINRHICKQMANKYGVDVSLIHLIVKRRIWRHI